MADTKAIERLRKFLRGVEELSIKEGYSLAVSSDITSSRVGTAVHMTLVTKNLNEEDAGTALEQVD